MKEKLPPIYNDLSDQGKWQYHYERKTMRRPPLTRKKISLLHSLLYELSFNYEDCEEEHAEQVKELQEGQDFIYRLIRWHKWKQEQKGNKSKTEKEKRK